MTVQEVLQGCTIEGLTIKLPDVQIDKKTFAQVKKALTNIGGAWKGGKIFGFVFEEDPTDLLSDIASGKKRNIKQEFQFFGTSPELSDDVVDLAGIEEHHKICEPSAGDGAIVKAVNRLYPKMKVSCVELMPLNRKKLEAIPTVELIGDDFLQLKRKRFDRIVANPPFSKNQDIDHVMKMYECLKKGGRLVSITSIHYINSNGKKETKFKKWLEEVGAILLRNEGGAFKESGTNIETATLVINKN